MRTQVYSEGLTPKESTAQAAHKGCINILIQKLPEGSEYRTHYHLINNLNGAMYLKD